jgi:anti-sigma28 factor (negative regulator of flagellin synthesis)
MEFEAEQNCTHYSVKGDMNSKKESEKLAKELEAVRYRKIRKIRSRISSGSYHISNKLLAKSLFIAN